MSLLLLFHPGVGATPPPATEQPPQALFAEAGGAVFPGPWRERARHNRALGQEDEEDLLSLARAALEHFLKGGGW